MTGVLDSRAEVSPEPLRSSRPRRSAGALGSELAAMAATLAGPRLRSQSDALSVCERAAAEGLPIYFYGSTTEILAALQKSLEERFPASASLAANPRSFAACSPPEKSELAARIVVRALRSPSSARAARGRKSFAYEFRDALSMPILAVGAAFPFFAGRIAQAPRWMQDRGLEWLFRLCVEPRVYGAVTSI